MELEQEKKEKNQNVYPKKRKYFSFPEDINSIFFPSKVYFSIIIHIEDTNCFFNFILKLSSNNLDIYFLKFIISEMICDLIY